MDVALCKWLGWSPDLNSANNESRRALQEFLRRRQIRLTFHVGEISTSVLGFPLQDFKGYSAKTLFV